MSDLWQLAATLGITTVAAAAAVWAMVKFLGEKLTGFYIDKALAVHRHALNDQAETHKSELRIEETAFKEALGHLFKREQMILEEQMNHHFNVLLETYKTKGQIQLAERQAELAADASEQGFKQQLSMAQVSAALEARNDDRKAQRALIDAMATAGIDIRAKEQIAISERRMPAYIALWSLTRPLSPRLEDVLDREELEASFRDWYYNEGHGLFLTWKAMDAYLFATNLLTNKAATDVQIREAFSGLRTQMKIDVPVYTLDEAVARVGLPGQALAAADAARNSSDVAGKSAPT